MNKNLIRIIPRLDIKNGLLIKGINFEGLRILGDPFYFAEKYYNDGADEILYVDTVASLYGTKNISKFINRTAKKLQIPLTVGGGVRSLGDIERYLMNGADKVTVNTTVVKNLKFLNKAAKIFGSSTITCAIEAIKIKEKYYVSTSNGRDLHNICPIRWSKTLEDNGAGEILISSVNSEGLKKGFDINLTKKISKKISIPTIAHGGAGSIQDIYNVIKNTNISGVSISSLLHYNSLEKKKIKEIFYWKYLFFRKSF